MVVEGESMCGNTTQEAVMTLTWGPPEEGNRYVQTFKLTAKTSQLANIALKINHTQVTFPNSTQHSKFSNNDDDGGGDGSCGRVMMVIIMIVMLFKGEWGGGGGGGGGRGSDDATHLHS